MSKTAYLTIRESSRNSTQPIYTSKEKQTTSDPQYNNKILEGTHYEIIKELGSGGIGTVYLARHRTLRRFFAIKVIRAELSPTPERVERLRREARAASLIRHPGIVDVTDFGINKAGKAFVVMEYVEGITLARALDENGPFKQEKVISFGLEMCEALESAHSKGVIHRDIKPENIFLVKNEGKPSIKIVDFSIALSSEYERERLTQHGTIFGTPEYISPEQIKNQPLTQTSDVYSLGVVLYEMLTGTVPFNASTSIETMAFKLRDTVEPPSQKSPQLQIHKELDQCIVCCLETSPYNRYQSMLELAEVLSETLESIKKTPLAPAPKILENKLEWTSTSPNPQKKRKLPHWILAMAILLLVPIGISVSFLIYRPYTINSLSFAEDSRENLFQSIQEEAKVKNANPMNFEIEITESEKQFEQYESISTQTQINREQKIPNHLASDRNAPEHQKKAQKKTKNTNRFLLLATLREGNRLLQKKRFGEAQRVYNKALKIQPGNSSALSGLGRVAFEQSRYPIAANYLEKALLRNAQNHPIRVLLGSTYLRLGQRNKAIQQWKRVLASQPNNRAAQRSLRAIRNEK